MLLRAARRQPLMRDAMQGPQAVAVTHPPPRPPTPSPCHIQEELGEYLRHLIYDKEQREYMGWLKKVHAFVK
jgi:hypothetical protein